MQQLQLLTDLLTNLINKTALFAFSFSALYFIRTLLLFVLAIKEGEKYILGNKQLTYLGIAISIIVTLLISGTKLI